MSREQNLTVFTPQPLVMHDLSIIVEKETFSLVILEVTHVFAVSRIGVPLFCCFL